jgi:hypothetical protein
MILFIIILILFFVFIIINLEYYNNLHEYLNHNLYKLPGNDIIPYYLDYNIINKGKSIASNSSIVICILARNISKVFYKSSQRLEYIGNKFKNYKIIIFENDSNDDSRNLFKQWENYNKNVILLNCHVIGNYDCKLNNKEGYDYGTISKNRFLKMAFYREQYLNYIRENYFNYDYMLVYDFDLDGNININGLYDTLAHDDWSAVFVNGKIPCFLTFGFIDINADVIASLFMEDDYDSIKYDLFNLLNILYKLQYNRFNNHFIQVKSAFSGCGIYKIKDVLDCSYIGDNNICEHINLAKCLYNKNKKLYINYFWEFNFNIQGPTPYKTLKDFFNNLFI